MNTLNGHVKPCSRTLQFPHTRFPDRVGDVSWCVRFHGLCSFQRADDNTDLLETVLANFLDLDHDDVVPSVVSNVMSSSVLFNITFRVVDITTLLDDLSDNVARDLENCTDVGVTVTEEINGTTQVNAISQALADLLSSVFTAALQNSTPQFFFLRSCFSVAREAQRLARSYQLQSVVLSCHYDYVAGGMLEPTWTFECDINLFRRFRGMMRSENPYPLTSAWWKRGQRQGSVSGCREKLRRG